MRRFASILVIACTAIIGACGTEPVAPPSCTINCTPTEVVTPAISGLVNGTSVPAGNISISATAISSKIGNITDSGKFSWMLDGTSIGNGMSVVMSVQPGTHTVCVYVTGQEKTGNVCVGFTATKTSITGKVVVLDLAQNELPPKGVRVSFSKGQISASALAESNGSFEITTGLVNEDSVAFVVDGVDPSNRIYHPMKGVVLKADLTKDIVFIMIPLSVTIPNGVYAGTVAPMDLNKAYIAGSDGSSFYGRHLVSGVWQYVVASHPVLPVPMAFRNDLGNIPIAGADSVTASLSIDILEQYVGLDMLRPAPRNEITDLLGVDVYMLTTVSDTIAGLGGVSYLGNGNLGHGVVVLKGTAYLLGTLRHELIHAFGFGHGCGWRSLQGNYCDGIDRGNNPFTPGLPSSYDVAYIRVMYKARDLERKYGTKLSVMESHQGERELMLGLPAEKVTRLP